jgi:hypothetical protein
MKASHTRPSGKGTRSAAEQAYVALLHTAEALQGEFAAWLKPQGLSPTQFNALRILRGAGPEGLPCREVGARMINRDPDVTRLLDRLEKHNLVTAFAANSTGASSVHALRRQDLIC